MKNTVQFFRALADETRLRIIALLSRGELCVCDIMAALNLPQSTVSRHLAYLRNAGWVTDRRQGVWMFYTLVDDENVLKHEVMAVLKAKLPDDPESVRDLANLDLFLKTKGDSACR